MVLLAGFPTISEPLKWFLDAGFLIILVLPGLYLLMYQPLLQAYEARLSASDQVLRRALTELEVIHANVPLAMIVVDRDRRVRQLNHMASGFAQRAMEDMIGLQSGEAIGCMHALDDPNGCGFGPSCSSCTLRLAVLDTLETGNKHEQIESWHSLQLGGKHEDRCLMISTARMSIDGEDRFLISLMDITERKYAEQALRESEERYKELFNNLSSGVSVYQAQHGGDDFVFVNINAVGERSGQVRCKDVVGRSVQDVFPAVKQIGLFDVFQQVWRTGQSQHHPLIQYQDARITRWLENYVFKLPTGEIVDVYDDRTEHVRTAKELKLFRMLLDRSHDGIEVVDPMTGRFLDVNEKSCLAHGYSRDEYLSLNVWDIDSTVDRLSFASQAEVIKNAGMMMAEGVHRRKDGTTFPVEVSLGYVQLDRDYMVAVVRDITERKRAAQALIVQQQQLIESEKLAALGRMTTGIAHEINQPLNAMRNFVKEILLNRQDGIVMSAEEERDNLERAVGQVDRMAEIIRNMRLFVRDNSELEFVSLLVKDLVEYPISLLGTQLRAQGIRIEIEHGEPDLRVAGNMNRLQQVMINLVVNARDAIEQARRAWVHQERPRPEEDHIILRWRRGEANRAVIEVEDTGVGISSEDTARIFEPFFTTKNRDLGTGLGLAICHELITKHGGTIQFDSKSGRGAIFIVELPLASKNDPDERQRMAGSGI